MTHPVEEYRSAIIADQTRAVTASKGGRFTEADARAVASGADAQIVQRRRGDVVPCPNERYSWCHVCGVPSGYRRDAGPILLDPTSARSVEWAHLLARGEA